MFKNIEQVNKINLDNPIICYIFALLNKLKIIKVSLSLKTFLHMAQIKQVTYDVTLNFGKNQRNRQINHSHKEEIKNEMLKHFEIIPPITVNRLTNNIIDGQHRAKAFQELIEKGQLNPTTRLLVMFVDIPIENEAEAIIDANTHSKNWSMDNYIYSYTTKVDDDLPLNYDRESYCKLNNFCLAHTLTSENGKSKFRYGAAIITGKSSAKLLKSGTFTVTDEQVAEGEEILREMEEIINLFDIQGKGAWIEGLAVAWSERRKAFPFKHFMRELKRKKNRFQKQPKNNAKDWARIFNEVIAILTIR